MVNHIGRFAWLTSDGGPLLLLARAYLRYWGGIDPPTGGRTIEARFRWSGTAATPATDYDRACDVDDELGLLAVGPGHALVLGDEPLATMWWPAGRTGGTLVRWRHAREPAAVERALAHLPQTTWVPTTLVLTVDDGPLYLFDAAYPGAALDASLEVTLGSSRYRLESGLYAPDATTALVLHRFVHTPA